MIRRKFWVLGSATAVLLFLGAFLFASPPIAEATLVVSEGEVTVEQAVNRMLVVPAREQVTLSSGESMALTAGDTLKLAEGATAQLRFMDGSTVGLSDEALLHVTELVDTEDSFRVRLYLFAGRTASRVVHLIDADDAFVISTPSSTTSVRGTRFIVNVIDEASSEVACEEGSVLVSTEEESVEVPAGFQLRVETGKPLEVQPRLDPENPAITGYYGTEEAESQNPVCPPGGCFVPSPTPTVVTSQQVAQSNPPQQNSQPVSQPSTKATTKPSAIPSATATKTATATATATSTATKTATPTATASATPAATSTRSATAVPTSTPTTAPTSAPTATPGSSSVDTDPATPPPDEPTPTATPTIPTPTPVTPTAEPTSVIVNDGDPGVDSLPADPTTPAPAATTPPPTTSSDNPQEQDGDAQGDNEQ